MEHTIKTDKYKVGISTGELNLVVVRDIDTGKLILATTLERIIKVGREANTKENTEE